MRDKLFSAIAGAVLAPAIAASTACAQEAINSDAATQPSPGVWVVRQKAQFIDYGTDPTGLNRNIAEYRAITTINYGLSRNWALTFSQPVVFRDTEIGAMSDTDSGLDDGMFMLKYRLFKHDFGPIDTFRISLMSGTSIPWGADAFSSDSFDPMIGAVGTLIYDRHGANASLRYRFNAGDDDELSISPGSGPDDALMFDSAYLYRIQPASFSNTNSHGAWYVVLESNAIYETNGDAEWRLAPGIMYEGTTFAFEFSVQLPVWQDLEYRPEADVKVTIGGRWMF